ncbi:hypothetical protein BDA99DRAFT_574023 [Phascolomyces articulosus]|uniref:Uncharacterized protein n=1 Tax=Phascolomyces articulosus TaxID=60185 RepID=A0AAD5JVJ3_9FUNG|nr:hypothetical protein BDA99DRAFT_574023 [Phascolomyces articulosus]
MIKLERNQFDDEDMANNWLISLDLVPVWMSHAFCRTVEMGDGQFKALTCAMVASLKSLISLGFPSIGLVSQKNMTLSHKDERNTLFGSSTSTHLLWLLLLIRLCSFPEN